jgi:hypothetical protein
MEVVMVYLEFGAGGQALGEETNPSQTAASGEMLSIICGFQRFSRS